MINHLRALIYLFLAGLTFGMAPAFAQSGGPIPDNVMVIEVLPGWRTAKGTHMAAFRLRLKPGWKTYWRAPGDGGIPPQFDWSGSDNIDAAQLHWPRPKVSYPNGMRTIGYTDEVIIPVEFTPRRAGKPMTMKGRVDLGVCDEICVPLSLEFSGILPSQRTKPEPLIRAALKAAPTPASKAGVTDVRCAIEPIPDGLRLTATITMPSTGAGEIAVIEAADQSIWVSEASSRRHGRTLTAVAEMVPPTNAPFMLDRSQIRITVLGANKAVDIQGCVGG